MLNSLTESFATTQRSPSPIVDPSPLFTRPSTPSPSQTPSEALVDPLIPPIALFVQPDRTTPSRKQLPTLPPASQYVARQETPLKKTRKPEDSRSHSLESREHVTHMQTNSDGPVDLSADISDLFEDLQRTEKATVEPLLESALDSPEDNTSLELPGSPMDEDSSSQFHTAQSSRSSSPELIAFRRGSMGLDFHGHTEQPQDLFDTPEYDSATHSDYLPQIKNDGPRDSISTSLSQPTQSSLPKTTPIPALGSILRSCSPLTDLTDLTDDTDDEPVIVPKNHAASGLSDEGLKHRKKVLGGAGQKRRLDRPAPAYQPKVKRTRLNDHGLPARIPPPIEFSKPRSKSTSGTTSITKVKVKTEDVERKRKNTPKRPRALSSRKSEIIDSPPPSTPDNAPRSIPRHPNWPIKPLWPSALPESDVHENQTIGCDICLRFYHYGCVGMAFGQEPDDWLCPCCEPDRAAAEAACAAGLVSPEERTGLCCRHGCTSGGYLIKRVAGIWRNALLGDGSLGTRYLVDWEAYDLKDCTWEPIHNLSPDEETHNVFIEKFNEAVQAQERDESKDIVLLQDVFRFGRDQLVHGNTSRWIGDWKDQWRIPIKLAREIFLT
ncbi:hypothetical protein DL96DRAFT_1048307 [Flagelloscypha sp. PMI_526]|nr:hypothetical protein DL96DRAFT_1048307 [Flagelloscypha sp. PMI_526]